MAKSKKPAKKKPAAKKPKKSAAKARRPKKAARNRSLPGMELVRDSTMDAFCEGIVTAREKKNRAIESEKEETSGALETMRRKGYSRYKHDGIELRFVPGADKLVIRKTKGDAEEGGEHNLPEAEDAGGASGEDAGE
jgi:hypothetical protein